MDLDGLPWGEMGVVSAIVVVVLFGMYFAKDIVLALLRLPRVSKIRTDTPRSPGARTIAWAEQLTASQVKAKAEETQDERIDRIEARIETCFEVEGKHRAESLSETLRLNNKIERLRERADAKNDDQDRITSGLSAKVSRFEGMLSVSGLVPNEEKPK